MFEFPIGITNLLKLKMINFNYILLMMLFLKYLLSIILSRSVLVSTTDSASNIL